MRRRFALKSAFLMMLALFVGQPLHLFAQNEEKLSVTTQMFLKELNGEISFERETQAEKKLGLIPVDVTWQRKNRHANRLYALPDTIDGKAYIAAYLRLADAAGVSEVEAQGVIIQEKFSNGLYTSLIPVDKINEIAGISKVKRINVSPLKKLMTNVARQKTNTDDILTLSTDAIAEGLTKKYDGTGVLLGVIDTGIDFQHIAFKDKDGKYRMKRAYVYNGRSATEYDTFSSSSPTTDDTEEDHGTHTSSTAGGSSVIVNGSSVTVTDNHANATYGGMAPGADLYLAGVNGLADTYLSNAVSKIVQYADNNNMPVVVSNSWGGQFGPHDGTGDVADVYNSLFGDSHPNHIALFASSNDGGKSKDGEGGGYHVSGTASSSSPLSTILRSATYINTDAGYFYQGIIANAWARSTSVSKLGIKIHVLDASTGEVKKSVTITSAGSVSGLSTYYSGTLYVYYDQVTSNKTQVLLYSSNGITSQGVTTTTKNGETYYKSKYTLAIQVYPISGSSVVDVWGGTYGYFTNHLTTSGYNWKAGSDDMSVSDETTIANVISVGAYVTKNSVTDYNGTSHSMSADFPTIGDIAYFSSYATASESPTGVQYPWITGPGATIVSAVNHYDTSGEFSYINGNSAEYGMYRVNSNTTNPYGSMEGTSMATPTVAGIVALWLQAAKEVGKNMTVNDIKEVMRETAIKDSYTRGTNASHFGQGKIDALAGIKYILGASSSPTIKTDKTEVAFEGYATRTYTETISVTGINLEGNITVSKSGSNVFSVDKTRITQSNGVASAEITVTYAPTSAGTQTGTITLSSNNAEDVTISLTGTAEAATPTIVADKESLEFTAMLDKEVSQTINVGGRFLTGDITATLTDPNGVFSVDKSSFEATEEGVSVSITFNSAEEGIFEGSLLLASAGAASVTINLTATARDGGTASDAYLNIAKYATIDEARWRTALVNNIYRYNEDEDNEVAWLTLPLYGAFVGAKYSPSSSTINSGHPQAWIETSLDNQNTYAGTSWNASGVFAGSSTYFTSATARALSNNSQSNTVIRNVAFYVTNVSEVRLYGTGRSGVNSDYPAALKVYECTMGADGSVNASTSATKNLTSTSTSTFTLSATDLDESKIYKVEASIYRGYLYEIGFQTPIEVEKVPTIMAEPTEIAFDAIYATTEETQTFTVSAKYLEGEVDVTVNDENGVFSVDKTTIPADEAMSGAEVVVTFHPLEEGNYTGSITLSSEGAENIVLTLSGIAEPATPTILVDKQTLTFNASVDTELSQNVVVTGRFINADVNLTLADANGVFGVSPATLSAEDIAAGAEVTITFNASQEGTYVGTLTLASEGAEPVTIQLSASAYDGGTASDPYLNIAKYATIDEAGWNETYVNSLYKYTEYEEDEVAWLTLPIYGAWVGTYYNEHPQKWIESNVNNTSNKYAGTTWNGNNELLGSSPYFTSAGARAMGYNSRNNYTQETVSFYVSNTTAVKLLGLGQSRTNSNYPATLKVFECTINGDGAPIASSTAVKSESNSATSGTFVLSATDLDASKVYKVEAATYRSYICEIGFQTSLKKPVLLGDVNRDGEISIADVTALVNIILGKDTEEQYDHLAADVNQDGDITIADVTALVNYILGK